MTTYNSLPDTTRIWIYQSNRPISDEKLPELKVQIQQFAKNWVSHNRELKAFGDVLHNQFVVLMVDESMAGASGCSIDSSVHFVQSLERNFGLSLFDRMTFTYQDGEEVKSAPRDEFAQLYAEGKINDETLVFDNLVKNKAEFEARWLKPLGQSWHKRMV
ncbi:hypothetical protein OAF63_05895 [Saprospiraceae bacterium]|nr:hypothetical protein [Saprospiraceae bacterium]